MSSSVHSIRVTLPVDAFIALRAMPAIGQGLLEFSRSIARRYQFTDGAPFAIVLYHLKFAPGLRRPPLAIVHHHVSIQRAEIVRTRWTRLPAGDFGERPGNRPQPTTLVFAQSMTATSGVNLLSARSLCDDLFPKESHISAVLSYPQSPPVLESHPQPPVVFESLPAGALRFRTWSPEFTVSDPAFGMRARARVNFFRHRDPNLPGSELLPSQIGYSYVTPFAIFKSVRVSAGVKLFGIETIPSMRVSRSGVDASHRSSATPNQQASYYFLSHQRTDSGRAVDGLISRAPMPEQQPQMAESAIQPGSSHRRVASSFYRRWHSPPGVLAFQAAKYFDKQQSGLPAPGLPSTFLYESRSITKTRDATSREPPDLLRPVGGRGALDRSLFPSLLSTARLLAKTHYDPSGGQIAQLLGRNSGGESSILAAFPQLTASFPMPITPSRSDTNQDGIRSATFRSPLFPARLLAQPHYESSGAQIAELIDTKRGREFSIVTPFSELTASSSAPAKLLPSRLDRYDIASTSRLQRLTKTEHIVGTPTSFYHQLQDQAPPIHFASSLQGSRLLTTEPKASEGGDASASPAKAQASSYAPPVVRTVALSSIKAPSNEPGENQFSGLPRLRFASSLYQEHSKSLPPSRSDVHPILLSSESSETSADAGFRVTAEAALLGRRRLIHLDRQTSHNRDEVDGRSGIIYSHRSRTPESRNSATQELPTRGPGGEAPAVRMPGVRALTEQDIPALTNRIYALLADQIRRQKRVRGL